MCAQKSLV